MLHSNSSLVVVFNLTSPCVGGKPHRHIHLGAMASNNTVKLHWGLGKTEGSVQLAVTLVNDKTTRWDKLSTGVK